MPQWVKNVLGFSPCGDLFLPGLKSLCENKSFGSRVDRIERTSSLKGGIMMAQHVAEGGVLGEVGSRSESPGDDTGSHTGSKALTFFCAPFGTTERGC